MSVKSRLRIGIIGLGSRGGMRSGGLAKNWHQPQGRSIVVAGMDINEDFLAPFKKSIGPDVFVTRDIKRFLAREDIEAVAVASPDFTHEEYVLQAFKAGKHVFCEKPMAITTEGCDRMLEAWHNSGKHFMVGFNMRYMNLFRVMKDIADSGVIGQIKVVWVRHFVGHGGDWYYHDWHANSKNTTSLLLQKGSHDIDMIHWITGKYSKKVCAFGSLDYYGGDQPDTLRCPQCPKKDECVEYQYVGGGPGSNRNMCVFRKPDEAVPEAISYGPGSNMNMCVFRKGVDVEDQSTVVMELEGGIKAVYLECHYAPDTWRNYTFIGTEGRMENLDDESKVIVKTRERSKRWKNLADQVYDIKQAAGEHGGADPLICKDFVDMVLDNKKPVATPLAGRMSVAVGCAATESIRKGLGMVVIRPVSANLKDKDF